MRQSRRTRLALLVSLILHVSLLVLLWRAREPQPPKPPPEPERYTVWFEESPAPAEPVPAPPAPMPRPRPPVTPPPAERPPEVQPPPTATPVPKPETKLEHPPTDGQEQSGGQYADNFFEPPRRLDLEPPVTLGEGDDAEREDGDPHGRTIRNGDPGPDPEALAEYQAEAAKRRIDGWIDTDVAQERAGRGQYDPYFTGMRKTLEGEAKDAPGLSKNALQNLFTGWTGALDSYGRTGNPYAPGEVGEEHVQLKHDSPLNEAADQSLGGRELGAGERGHGTVRDLRDRLRANAMLRDFAQGKMGTQSRLVALVEIRQSSNGAHESSVLVESSGNGEFDRHVLKIAPAAVAKLPPPPPSGQGIHAEGFRTHWRFEGRVVFLSKPSDLDVGSAGTMAATSVLNALTGGAFPVDSNTLVDETTGEVQVVDFSKAKLVTRVKLVRVF